MYKILRRRDFIMTALFLVLVGFIVMKKIGFPPYYQTDKAVLALKKSDNYIESSFDISSESVQVVQSGTKGQPVVLFIHGSPGRWTAWADYLLDKDLNNKAHLIAIDRPGFGGSDNGYHEPILKKQAQLIMSAIDKLELQNHKIILVGHSYGGPVALRIAIDYSERIQSMMLLAPSIDPALEDNRWFNKLAAVSFIRAIIPVAVDRSNQEILSLQYELQKIQPKLKNIKVKTSIIQGIDDKLVPSGNAAFGERELLETDIKLIPDQGHFIPWEQYDLVKSTLLEHLNPLYYD